MKALSRVLAEEFDASKYGLITVSDVAVTSGLERADIYVSALQHGREAVEKLNKQRAQIKQALHSEVNLRKIPKLEFIHDASSERVERLEELSDQANVEDGPHA